MSEITINPAAPTDIAEIVALLADDPIGRTREDTSKGAEPRYAGAFEAVMADPNATILVARDRDSIVGSVQLNILAGLSYCGIKRALIEDMRVTSDRRGHGIGRRLLEAALYEAKRAGCELAELFVHEDRLDAHQFYAACGFTGEHKGFRKKL